MNKLLFFYFLIIIPLNVISQDYQLINGYILKTTTFNSIVIEITQKEKSKLEIDLSKEDTSERYYHLTLSKKDGNIVFSISDYTEPLLIYDGKILVEKNKSGISKRRASPEVAKIKLKQYFNSNTLDADLYRRILQKKSKFIFRKEKDTLINNQKCQKISILKKEKDTSSLYYPSYLSYLYISYADSLLLKRSTFKRNHGFDFYWNEEVNSIKVNKIDFIEMKRRLTRIVDSTKTIIDDKVSDSYPEKKRKRNKLLDTGMLSVNWVLPIYGDSTKTLELYSINSNYTLLDFWYASCAPCLESIPELKEIRNAIDSTTLTIIGVNIYDTDLSRIDAINKRFRFNYTNVYKGKNTSQNYGVYSAPTVFLIDNKTKKIVLRLKGYSKGHYSKILSFLKNKKSH